MQLRVAAAEDLAEGLAEIRVQLGKLAREDLLHIFGELVDDLVQLALRLFQIVLLRAEELIPLAQLFVLLDRVKVDVAERTQTGLEVRRVLFRLRHIGKRLRNERGGCGCQFIAFPQFIQNLRLFAF